MGRFDSGVSGFIKGRATIEVNFPVDWKGRADISCYQCDLFSRSTGKCSLTGRVSEYPQKYVGSYCLLEFEENGENEGDETDVEI